MSPKDKSTIFVRNLPSDCHRSELEDLFSSIVGPVKKCAIIQKKVTFSQTANAGFGFVRFASEEDCVAAVDAVLSDANAFVLQRENRSFVLQIERAIKKGADTHDNDKILDTQSKSSTSKSDTPKKTAAAPADGRNDADEANNSEALMRRKDARVIIRNLAFTARRSHVQAVCEQFGEIDEIHLPTVNVQNKKKQHRGFAFVTFMKASYAQKAVEACGKSTIKIKDRAVAIDFSVSKFMHQQQKLKSKQKEQDEDDNETEVQQQGTKTVYNDDENDIKLEDNQSLGVNSDDGEDSHMSDDEDQEPQDDVGELKTLFVRNLPFDATRHTLFGVFKGFGRIESIYLVTDKVTGIGKGTAFVKFTKKSMTDRALSAGRVQEDAPFVTAKESTFEDKEMNEGIFLGGRRLLVDLAVDRGTASTLKVERDEDGKAIKKAGKDRRNLYLKVEGYVENNEDADAWINLPKQDQDKRMRALTEKNSKLRSPLFFINAFRLSLRNVAKHIEEKDLKKLIVTGIQEGLRREVVTPDDVTAHLRAQGLPPRECVGEAAKVHEFDEKDVKRFIPSLYIDKDDGESRGFAFVEFTYHEHALACLRELNNNPKYSSDWVIMGKKMSEAKKAGKKQGVPQDYLTEEGKILVPRLLVEFTVENKAKAKLQAKRRATQQANFEKQKQESKKRKVESNDGGEEKEKKKKSRGQKQRERKKRKLEEGDKPEQEVVTEKPNNGKLAPASAITVQPEEKDVKPKKAKLGKKNKINKEEKDFDQMVQNYKKTFTLSVATASDEEQRNKKRWFD